MLVLSFVRVTIMLVLLFVPEDGCLRVTIKVTIMLVLPFVRVTIMLVLPFVHRLTVV